MEDLSFLEGASNIGTAMDEIMVYVSNLERIEAEIENAETKVAELKLQRKRLAEDIIPMYMDGHGLEELKLANGKKLTVKEDVFARIPADAMKRAEALEWLRNNGAGDKIKTELIVDEPDDSIMDALSAMGAAYSRSEGVNTNSLQAFFRETLGLKKGSLARYEVQDIPQVFGVFIKKDTKLS